MDQQREAEYSRAIVLARRIAAEIGEPLFYRERQTETERSRELFNSAQSVADMVHVIETRKYYPGHGLVHAQKVALDAGAIVLSEHRTAIPDKEVRRIVMLAHLAGLLHDIGRAEENHAETGAREAEKLLVSFPLDAGERASVASAIRNHEAFRNFQTDLPPSVQLLSDSLYDADKFRWGPDNFTETLWAMTAPRGIPLQKLLPRFEEGMKGIAMIRGSFRTTSGRYYGPDFIDRGLEIGRRLYSALQIFT